MADEALIFIDVEASSLGGVPIEIGWAILPTGFTNPADDIQSDGFLVRPTERWLADPTVSWDPKAEALHGISVAKALSEGIPVDECVGLLSKAWGGRTVWCDSRGLDRAWLEVLHAEVTGSMGLPFRVRYWGELFEAYWKQDSVPVQAAREFLAALAPRHRARPDAVRLALAFAAAWQANGRTA